MKDRVGRRVMILFGLVVSALRSLTMAFVGDLQLFYIVAGFVGLLGNTGGTAQQAMVADLIPEKQLTEGYGIQRVVQNMTVSIGPAIGGFLATSSFTVLFIFDAVTSIITAFIVYYNLPETKPETPAGQEEYSLATSFGGYGKVWRERVYVCFLFVSEARQTRPSGVPMTGVAFASRLVQVNSTMLAKSSAVRLAQGLHWAVEDDVLP